MIFGEDENSFLLPEPLPQDLKMDADYLEKHKNSS